MNTRQVTIKRSDGKQCPIRTVCWQLVAVESGKPGSRSGNTANNKYNTKNIIT